MRRLEIALCLTTIAYAPLTSAAGFDDGASASGMSVTSGYTLRYRTLFPAERGREFGTFVTGDAAGEHRIFFDTKNGFYYGYDLQLTQAGLDGRLLLRLGPFSADAERQFRAVWPKMCSGCPDPRPVSSAKQRFPGPQAVAPGDKVVVDLLSDERSGDVVSEEITVVSKNTPPRENRPRDFRVEDVELQILHPKLFVEGQAVCKAEQTGYLSGDVVWLQVPGHGRAFFSLVPRPGFAFEKTGTVVGNKLRATIAGTRYEWVTETPIVTPERPPYVDAQAWNLWVLHDHDFIPTRPGCVEEGGGLDERLRRP